MSAKKFSNELRKAAKRANQRMLELEKRGINSPAYIQAQSMLEMLGKGQQRLTVEDFRKLAEEQKANCGSWRKR